MLKTASKPKETRQRTTGFDVEIAGVAVAVPEHKVSQQDIAERAKAVFPHLARLGTLYSIPASRLATRVSRRTGITSAMAGKRAPKCSSVTRWPSWKR